MMMRKLNKETTAMAMVVTERVLLPPHTIATPMATLTRRTARGEGQEGQPRHLLAYHDAPHAMKTQRPRRAASVQCFSLQCKQC